MRSKRVFARPGLMAVVMAGVAPFIGAYVFAVVVSWSQRDLATLLLVLGLVVLVTALLVVWLRGHCVVGSRGVRPGIGRRWLPWTSVAAFGVDGNVVAHTVSGVRVTLMVLPYPVFFMTKEANEEAAWRAVAKLEAARVQWTGSRSEQGHP